MAIVSEQKNNQWVKAAKNAVKNAVLPRKDTDLWDFLPYKNRVTDLKGHENILELTGDYGFAAFVNIPGKDLDFISTDGDSGSASVIQGFHHLLNVFNPDWSAVITQLPADTTDVQKSWHNELALIEQEIPFADDERKYNQLMERRELAEHQIQIAKNVASSMKHQEYTGIIFGQTKAEVVENQRAFIQSGGLSVQATPLTAQRLEQILSLWNDPTADID